VRESITTAPGSKAFRYDVDVLLEDSKERKRSLTKGADEYVLF